MRRIQKLDRRCSHPHVVDKRPAVGVLVLFFHVKWESSVRTTFCGYECRRTKRLRYHFEARPSRPRGHGCFFFPGLCGCLRTGGITNAEPRHRSGQLGETYRLREYAFAIVGSLRKCWLEKVAADTQFVLLDCSTLHPHFSEWDEMIRVLISLLQ